jgi:hypothetical protein
VFTFEELDDTTRRYMLEEFRAEQLSTDPPPFRPANLTGEGEAAFVEVMERAIQGGDEETLAADLSNPHFWITTQSGIRGGRVVTSRHRVSELARRFAITDFNIWYIRGLCRRLMDEGVDLCEVYRAAPAYVPRSECRALEGKTLLVQDVYAGHRAKYHPVKNPRAFSIPAGPNCHHSIRRVRR